MNQKTQSPMVVIKKLNFNLNNYQRTRSLTGPQNNVNLVVSDYKILENQSNGNDKAPAGEKNPSDSSVKNTNKEKLKEEDNQNLCRICLKEGCIPIYGDDTLEDLSKSIITFTGIEISINDPHPKFLCQPCNTVLQEAILLRKTAQQSDEILKQENLRSTGIINSNNHLEVIDNFPDDDNHPKGDISSKYDRNARRVRLIYFCQKCDESFHTLQEFDDHRYYSFEHHKQYHCKKCNESFNSKKEWNNHYTSKEHRNKKLKTQACPVCKKTVVAAHLKKHLYEHEREAEYICDICGRSFKTKPTLQQHQPIHSSNLPYQCAHCPYKGRYKEALKMHLRSHTGEKPYLCSKCPLKFRSKSNLNTHTVRYHSGGPHLKCKFKTCCKRFYFKHEIEIHYRNVHMVTEHICNICKEEFRTRNILLKHQIVVHNRAKMRCGNMPVYLRLQNMEKEMQDISIELDK